MKGRVRKCLHFQSQAECYGGRVNFNTMEEGEIARIVNPMNFRMKRKVG